MPGWKEKPMSNYWNSVLTTRLGRRRALAATAAAASAAALLAACGSFGGSSKEKAASSTLISQPVDTLKVAKRGGVLKDRTYSDTPTFEMFNANSPWNSAGPHVYNSLVQLKPGYLRPSSSEIAPDLIESWETSPDG